MHEMGSFNFKELFVTGVEHFRYLIQAINYFVRIITTIVNIMIKAQNHLKGVLSKKVKKQGFF